MRPAINYILANLGRGRTGVEVGVENGCHALEMYNVLGPRQLYLVDPWKNYKQCMEHNPEVFMEVARTDEQYLNTLKKFMDKTNVTILRLESLKAVNLFVDGQLDFVYIDGCHSTDAVEGDILSWLPKVRSGGILAGHDYETWESVRRAVDLVMPEDFDVVVTNNDWRVVVP